MAKVVKKGKKKRKPHKASKRWEKYDASGKPKQKFCPRCGPGVFLAKHKNRIFCGKCHYTSFDKEEIANSIK